MIIIYHLLQYVHYGASIFLVLCSVGLFSVIWSPDASSVLYTRCLGIVKDPGSCSHRVTDYCERKELRELHDTWQVVCQVRGTSAESGVSGSGMALQAG